MKTGKRRLLNGFCAFVLICILIKLYNYMFECAISDTRVESNVLNTSSNFVAFEFKIINNNNNPIMYQTFYGPDFQLVEHDSRKECWSPTDFGFTQTPGYLKIMAHSSKSTFLSLPFTPNGFDAEISLSPLSRFEFFLLKICDLFAGFSVFYDFREFYSSRKFRSSTKFSSECHINDGIDDFKIQNLKAFLITRTNLNSKAQLK